MPRRIERAPPGGSAPSSRSARGLRSGGPDLQEEPWIANSAYANWAVPLFSAAVGASQPKLAGTGFEAAPWAEALLTLSPVGGVLAPILCAVLVLRALGREARSPETR